MAMKPSFEGRYHGCHDLMTAMNVMIMMTMIMTMMNMTAFGLETVMIQTQTLSLLSCCGCSSFQTS